MRALQASALVVLAMVFVVAGRHLPKPLTATAGVQSDRQDAFNESLLRAFTFRNVGPFRMQARASAIAVPASPAKEHLYTFYVATWTGGVFKTTNGGVTFTPVFDKQNKLTIGA